MTEPRPVTDLSPADWIVAGVERDDGVGSLLPAGFEAYARVLHPAAQWRGGEPRAVTWAEVAQANKRRLHRLVQFDALIGVDRDEQSDYAVATGEIPDEVQGPFFELLSRHTDDPDDCWFGLWDGWGGLGSDPSATTLVLTEPGDPTPHVQRTSPPYPPEVIDGPRISLPGREYILLRGPLSGIGEVRDELWPSLVWPGDRAWCVATDIDLDSTYVGGSAALIAELLDDLRLETWTAQIEDRVDVGADEINPKPRSRG